MSYVKVKIFLLYRGGQFSLGIEKLYLATIMRWRAYNSDVGAFQLLRAVLYVDEIQ